MNDKLETSIAETENAIIGMFSRDVLERGRALMSEDDRIYGNSTAQSIHDNTAQNYIYSVANVNFANRIPITQQVFAAAKLMSLALAMVTTNASQDVLARAVKEIGSLARRLADSQRIEREKPQGGEDEFAEVDEDVDGRAAADIISRVTPASAPVPNRTPMPAAPEFLTERV